MDTFQTLLSRVIAGLVAAGAGYLSTKLSIPVSADTQAAITSAVTLGIYGIVHKLIDRSANPTDAAHPAEVAK